MVVAPARPVLLPPLVLVNPSPHDPTLMAVAMRWVSRITTVSLEMVLPGLAGMWADREWGTVVLFTLLGFGLGMAVGIWHLIRMTSHDEPPSSDLQQETRSDAARR